MNHDRPKVCTYDNPSRMRRECWSDGHLVCHYSAAMICEIYNGNIPGRYLFVGANIGPWEEGQLNGDPDVMPEQEQDVDRLACPCGNA